MAKRYWTEERVEQHIVKDANDPINGHWIWTGPVRGGGGSTSPRVGAAINVRAYCWVASGRPLIDNMLLKQACGEAVNCVNPAHMEVGNRQCGICRRQDRQDIDALIANRSEPLRSLAQRVNVSGGVLRNHRDRHSAHGRDLVARGKREQVARPEHQQQPKVERASAWLRHLLGVRHPGGLMNAHVFELGAAEGIAKHHLRAAFRVLRVRRFKTSRRSSNWWRLPTEDEQAAARLVNQRTPSLYAKVPIKAGDVKRIVTNKLTRRGARWSSVTVIKSWVGKEFHDLALTSAEELHHQARAEKLIDGAGKLKAYRMPPATPFDTIRDKQPIVHVMGDETLEQVAVDTVPAAAVARTTERIYQSLLLKGVAMSTNDLHEHLGSSRRGAPAVFNAALEQLVEEGRVQRNKVGKTNYYEVLAATADHSRASYSPARRSE